MSTASFRFYPRGGWTSRVTGAKVQGSHDGVAWTDLVTISTQPTDSVWTVINFTADLTSYAFLRYLSPASGYGNIAEIEFYDGTYGSGGTKLSATNIIASVFGGSNPPANAFDGDTTTFFEGSGPDNQYVGISTLPPQSSIRYYPRSGLEGRMNGGYFQVCNDYTLGTLTSGSWQTVYTIPSTPASGWNVVDVSVDFSMFRYIRYVAPVGGYGNVAELTYYKYGTYSTTGVLIVPIASDGTPGSYSGTSADIYSAALDGNTSTYFDSTQADGAVIDIDQGAFAVSPRPFIISQAVNRASTY